MGFFDIYGKRLVSETIAHLEYVLVSVGLAFFIALALGILLSRMPKAARVVLPILSLFQTIPGVVFVGTLFLFVGMKPVTIYIALTMYAVFPILKNTYTGLLEVDPSLIEAAKGCGMSPLQTLWEVELPLATASIIGGLRMSTVYTVSWAVLAAMIGQGGLGEFIYMGVSSNNNRLILAGAIPSAVMAIVLSLVIDTVKKYIIPRGLRGERA